MLIPSGRRVVFVRTHRVSLLPRLAYLVLSYSRRTRTTAVSLNRPPSLVRDSMPLALCKLGNNPVIPVLRRTPAARERRLAEHVLLL